MPRCVIVYGTKEGHTARIAERLAATLRESGTEVDAFEVSSLAPGFSLEAYDGALVGGSIHMGEYKGAVKDFAKAHRDWLDSHPSAFFSISLSAASDDADNRAEIQRYQDEFVRETGWQPRRFEHVAGALVYSQYPFFVRQVMRLKARQEHLDTSADHDYTDYERVAAFAREFAATLPTGARA